MFLVDEVLAKALHKEYEERLQRQQMWHGYVFELQSYAGGPRRTLLPAPLVSGYRQMMSWLYTYALHWRQRLQSSQRLTDSAAPNVRQ